MPAVIRGFRRVLALLLALLLPLAAAFGDWRVFAFLMGTFLTACALRQSDTAALGTKASALVVVLAAAIPNSANAWMGGVAAKSVASTCSNIGCSFLGAVGGFILVLIMIGVFWHFVTDDDGKFSQQRFRFIIQETVGLFVIVGILGLIASLISAIFN